MSETIQPGYRRLAITTIIFIYLLIIAGALVRVTDSGLGCPDWPTCYGKIIPPLELTAIIEYTHRSIAAIGGIFIFLTALFAWIRYRKVPWIVIPASLVIGLLVVQVPLGAIVVLTELDPDLVSTHFGMALLIFGSALTVGVVVTRPVGDLVRGTQAQRNRLIWTLVALFVLIITGTIVVGRQASFACPSWPLCNNQFGLIPPVTNVSPLIWLHFTHRLAVLAFSILFVWVVLSTLRDFPDAPALRLWTWLAVAFFVGQIAVGAVQVWLHKPPALQATHVALAAGVWASMVVLTMLTVHGVKKAG